MILTDAAVVATMQAVKAIAEFARADLERSPPELIAVRAAFHVAFLRGLADLMHIKLPPEPDAAGDKTDKTKREGVQAFPRAHNDP
jgi:hypothetical protein